MHRPFVLGFFTGINLCPVFLIALTKAVSLSGALAGMLFFFAFFVGNSVYVVPLSPFGIFGARKTLRNLRRIAARGVRVWFLVSAVRVVV